MATITAKNGYALNWSPSGLGSPELRGEWTEIIRLTDTVFEAVLPSGYREVYTGRGFRGDNPIVTGYSAFKPNGQLAVVGSDPSGVPADRAVDDFVLFELTGADTIQGANLSDSIYGFDGNDVMIGNGGNDFIDGGNGNDRLEGGNGDDQLVGGRGNDQIDGGPGDDVAIFSAASLAYEITNEAGTIRTTPLGNGPDGTDTLIDVERLRFTDKTLSLADLLSPDPLAATSGPDTLIGTGSDETISGLGGGDVIVGKAGDDQLFGNADDDRLDGGKGDDRLVGGQGADVLRGGGGNDVLLGQGGDDLLLGQGGADELRGGVGNDELRGGTGPDVLAGGKNGDSLFGGGGVDRISGGGGNDALVGGPGADILTAGPGADSLVFNDIGDGIDTLTDFSLVDRVDIAAVLEGFVAGSSSLADFVRLAARGQDTMLQVDPDGGANDFQDLALLQDVTGLGLDDLVASGSITPA